jgi:hypothetical protein
MPALKRATWGKARTVAGRRALYRVNDGLELIAIIGDAISRNVRKIIGARWLSGAAPAGLR